MDYSSIYIYCFFFFYLALIHFEIFYDQKQFKFLDLNLKEIFMLQVIKLIKKQLILFMK